RAGGYASVFLSRARARGGPPGPRGRGHRRCDAIAARRAWPRRTAGPHHGGHFGMTTLNVFAPLLTVVLIPDLAGSRYWAGMSTALGAPLALPWDWAIILPIAWPLPATVSTAMLTSPRGTFCIRNRPSSSTKALADPVSFWAITSANGTRSLP